MPLTQSDRAERRKEIAATVRATGGNVGAVSAAAKKYGLTRATVERACLEHGVKIPRKPREDGDRITAPTLKIIRDLIAGKNGKDIAAEYGIKPARVSTIRKSAREAGLLK